jgi:hypothetical protein
MKKNMGGLDRTLRILVAIAIIVLYYENMISGALAIILLVVASIFILTSFVSFCPLYYPFRFSTRKSGINS